VRALCDEYGILLCADEVICGFGRLGEWLGTYRHDMQPDMISVAKGLSSGYGTLGALIASDELVAPFLEEKAMFMHGSTFGGHPVQAAIALKNIEIIEREGLVERVRDNEQLFRSTLEPLLDLPIVGDLRGEGYFYALELVRDKETKDTFDDEESEKLLRGFLTPRLFEAGLICRADDRGDPLIQVCPPLVAGKEEFDRIAGILGDVFTEAWSRFCE
jgi:adenosylmethionine-8-amino-7-oxononanoate aminotransferase